MKYENIREMIAAALMFGGILFAVGTCGAVETSMLPLENFAVQTIIALLMMAVSLPVGGFFDADEEKKNRRP